MNRRARHELKEMCNHLITESDFNTYNPQWFISISYLESYSKKYLVNKIHKRISDVIKDTFDPYDLNTICEAYFIEEGKPKYETKTSRTDSGTVYSYDQKVKGNLGSHLMLSLPTSPLDPPNKYLRKVWETMYWDFGGRPPMHLLEEDNHQELIAETLDWVIRDRCPSFIANGEKSLDVQLIDERREFRKSGSSWGKGWNGALNYCLKNVYKKDMFLNTLDTTNSNICVA